MKRWIAAVATCACACAGSYKPPARQSDAGRIVDVRASDGTLLKATYFAAAKPGPAVLLLPQSDRSRKSWNDVGTRLAAAGIHTLSLDLRGRGDSGSVPFWTLSDGARTAFSARWPEDIEAALAFLQAQPGVRAQRARVSRLGRRPGKPRRCVPASG